MGITIGDALSVVATFVALGLSLWATTILAALIAPSKAQIAKARVAVAPYRTGMTGLVAGFLWAGLGIVLLSQPAPIIKVLGLIVLGTLGSVTAVGMAGISLHVAESVGSRDPGLAGYTSLARAAGLLVSAAILPVLGWFFLGPIVLLVSIGAGVRAIFDRQREPVAAQVPPGAGGV